MCLETKHRSEISYRCGAYDLYLHCVCGWGGERLHLERLLKQKLTVEQTLFNDAQHQQENNAHQ